MTTLISAQELAEIVRGNEGVVGQAELLSALEQRAGALIPVDEVAPRELLPTYVVRLNRARSGRVPRWLASTTSWKLCLAWLARSACFRSRTQVGSVWRCSTSNTPVWSRRSRSVHRMACCDVHCWFLVVDPLAERRRGFSLLLDG